MEIKDKVVVVTGGGNGIGKALCERFYQEGARLIAVVDLEEHSAEKVASDIGGLAFGVDVTDEAQVAAMIAEVEGVHGHIDLVCSNAGVIFGDGEPWWATSAPNDKWQLSWQVHVMAHVYAARAALPKMIERGSGYFMNTVSAAGLLNQIGDTAYTTTKHAAIGFAESLSVTHGDEGIKVSVLCPQAVATRMADQMKDSSANVASVDGVITPEEVATSVVEGLAEEKFLILPHPEVEGYRQRKAENYDRWLGGMRKLRRSWI
jgi:NAD(P)-dependent dehydrogenase (short-subunit alcohol dehydrogenase family)